MPATTRAVRNDGVEAEAFGGEREVALGKKSRNSSSLVSVIRGSVQGSGEAE